MAAHDYNSSVKEADTGGSLEITASSSWIGELWVQWAHPSQKLR